MKSICLNENEIMEITGLLRKTAQLRWFQREGIVVRLKADGSPLVARSHFLQMMGSESEMKLSLAQEPDFSTL
jgi:hypothetical protein